MTKTVSEILFAAAALIEPEGAWTQGYYARGRSGRPVRNKKSATCFCALGAINVAAGNAPDNDARTPQRALEAVLRDGRVDIFDVPEWNDTPGRTQAEVVAKLREAAEKAREQGQ